MDCIMYRPNVFRMRGKEMHGIKVIGFDADDTLWDNLQHFLETADRCCELLSEYAEKDVVQAFLDQIEARNIGVFGYGTKSFTLSMIETACEISEGEVRARVIQKLIDFGKKQIQEPIQLIDGVEDVLKELGKRYRLVVATKGDLSEQGAKLERSGLVKYFHHVEVMSEKRVTDYEGLLKHLDIKPGEFMMVGNSLKSDVIPVLEMGGWGVHVPYHTTWVHEQVEGEVKYEKFREIEKVSDLLDLL